ncbi:hypothetical protein LJC20_00600 [Eubacteriales bacterium OttesenSCG-928-M02]|nr:hypothetical protein [Eubacteriales bacterium OttesenSCG-928-M02]
MGREIIYKAMDKNKAWVRAIYGKERIIINMNTLKGYKLEREKTEEKTEDGRG